MTSDDPATTPSGADSGPVPGHVGVAAVTGVGNGDTNRTDADGLDETELVGPGAYPLRIQPAAALMPGTADSRRLMIAWFIRKSFYWLFFLGYTIGAVAAAGSNDEALDVNWLSPNSIGAALLSPWFALLIALIVRFANSWVALGLAYPLAVAHEPNLSPRTNFGSGVGKFFDRLHVARAFRALRWTHHVRQVALQRLGRTGDRLGKLDPILDIANIASAVIGLVVIVVVAAQTAS